MSVNGTYGWRSNGAPLSDFWDVPLCEKRGDTVIRRRDVTILFDSDTATNRKVAQARHLFTEFLKRRGARVRHVDVPRGIDGEKQGIDDALAAGHALAHLLATAHPPRRPTPTTTPTIPISKDRGTGGDDRRPGGRASTQERARRRARSATCSVTTDAPHRSASAAVFLVAEMQRIARHDTIRHGEAEAQAVDAGGGVLLDVKPHRVLRDVTEARGRLPAKFESSDHPPLGHPRRHQSRDRHRQKARSNRATSASSASPSTVRSNRLRNDIMMPTPAITPRTRKEPTHRCPTTPDAPTSCRTTSECAPATSTSRRSASPATAGRTRSTPRKPSQTQTAAVRSSPRISIATIDPEIT